MNAQACPDAKAKELLQRILPESQWDRFNATGLLEITGSRAAYRICAGDLTQIRDATTGKLRSYACLQLTVPAPAHDRIIAEYLLIRNDEDSYWQTANMFPAGLENRLFASFLVAAADAVLLILLIAQLHG